MLLLHPADAVIADAFVGSIVKLSVCSVIVQDRSQAMTDASRRKERDVAQKDVDRLRSSIQSLTRSVNPLGKILDFLQEDVDAMQKELNIWRDESQGNAIALQREQRYHIILVFSLSIWCDVIINQLPALFLTHP